MKHLFALALAVSAAGAAAQEAARPDPADPRIKTPDARYRSAFDGYRGYTDKDRVPWRVANEEARELGGHVGQVRSSSFPKPGAREEKGQPHGGHR